MRFVLALVAVCLVSCSGGRHRIEPANRYQTQAFDVELRRGPEHQASIRVRRAPSPAAADEALLEMQGYVHGYDRFLSMDLTRRSASGRLAELFGERALPRDREAVGAGLRLAAERMLARLDRDFPEARRLLDAYTMGVNRALAFVPYAHPEYMVFYRRTTGDSTYRPEPWTALDSIYCILGVSFRLSGALKEKLMLGAIASRYYQPAQRPSFERLFDWRPLYDEFVIPPAPGPLLDARRAPARAPRSFLPVDVGCENTGFPFSNCLRETGYGSNNWVATRDFTGGAPFLANDPHLMLSFPMSMYEMSLDSKAAGGSFRARGFILPGTPGILIGHNDRIAWGFTNLTADVDDIYIERLTRRGTHVRFRGRDVRLEERNVVLKVRGADGQLRDDDVVTKLRIVPHHGPLFSDWKAGDVRFAAGLTALRMFVGEPVALSYRWTGHAGTGELAALLGVNRAGSFEQFKQALSTYEVGAQNMVYLDVDGNIGYYAPSKYPIRRYASANWPPYIPQEGTGESEWSGFRERVPEMYNPASGRIVTANNDPTGTSRLPSFGNYADYFGFQFSTGSRARRIVQLLDGQRGRLDLEAMKRIQTDHVDLSALAFTTLLENGGAALAARDGLTEDTARALESLRSFRGAMKRDERAPVLVDAWLRELGSLFWEPNRARGYELPEGITGMTMLVKTMYHRTRDGIARGTADTRQLLSSSLPAALARMRNAGHSLETRWGEVHRVSFGNVLPGLLPDLQPAPLERDGYYDTVDPSGPGLGPVFRLLITVENGAFRAVTSVPGGNYGVLQESEWRPELTAWRDGVYRPFVE